MNKEGCITIDPWVLQIHQNTIMNNIIPRNLKKNMDEMDKYLEKSNLQKLIEEDLETLMKSRIYRTMAGHYSSHWTLVDHVVVSERLSFVDEHDS